MASRVMILELSLGCRLNSEPHDSLNNFPYDEPSLLIKDFL